MKRQLAILLAMALIPACVFAADGALRIDQSTMMTAGGFPYTISSPGNYKLSGNPLAPANVNGIQIAASNVTVRSGTISGFAGQINLGLNGSFSLVEDQVLLQFGSFQARSGLGVSSVLRPVIADSIIAFQSPSVIVESVAQGRDTGHVGGSAFGHGSGRVF